MQFGHGAAAPSLAATAKKQSSVNPTVVAERMREILSKDYHTDYT